MQASEVSFFNDTASFRRQTEKGNQDQEHPRFEEIPLAQKEFSKNSQTANFAPTQVLNQTQEGIEGDFKQTAQFFFPTFEQNQSKLCASIGRNSTLQNQEPILKKQESLQDNKKYLQPLRNKSQDENRNQPRDKKDQIPYSSTKQNTLNNVQSMSEQKPLAQHILKSRSQPKLLQNPNEQIGKKFTQSSVKISSSQLNEDFQKPQILQSSNSITKNRYSSNRSSLPSNIGLKDLAASQISTQSLLYPAQPMNIMANQSSIITGLQQPQQGQPILYPSTSSKTTWTSHAPSSSSQNSSLMYSTLSQPTIKAIQDPAKNKYRLNNFVNLNIINGNSNPHVDQPVKNGNVPPQIHQKLSSRQKVEDNFFKDKESAQIQASLKLIEDISDPTKLAQISSSSRLSSSHPFFFEEQNMQNVISNEGNIIGFSNQRSQIGLQYINTNQVERLRQMNSGNQNRLKESNTYFEQVQKNLLDDNLLESLKRQQIQLQKMREQQLKNFEGLYTPQYANSNNVAFADGYPPQLEQQQQQQQQQQLQFQKQSATFQQQQQYKAFLQQQLPQQSQQYQSQQLQVQVLRREPSQRQGSSQSNTHTNDIMTSGRKEKYMTMESIIPEDLQCISKLNMVGQQNNGNHNIMQRTRNLHTFHTDASGNNNKNIIEGQQYDQEGKDLIKQNVRKQFYSLHQGAQPAGQQVSSMKGNPHDEFTNELEKARKQIKQSISKGNSYKVLQQFPQISSANQFGAPLMQQQKSLQQPKGGSAAQPLRKNIQLLSPNGLENRRALYEDMALNSNRETRTADTAHSQMTKMSEGKFKTFLQRKPQENILNKIFQNQIENLDSRE